MNAGARSTVIITMAGRGSRFRLAGYNVPKYRILVRGRSLFSWSIASLAGFTREHAQFVFIYLNEDDPRRFIGEECEALGIDKFAFVALDQVTDGQATTAMAAAAAIQDPASPVTIYNIDTYVEAQYLPPQAARGAGWIPCFPAEGSQWSFARTEKDQRVVEVREKQRISPHATVGLYWFDSFHRYSDAYSRYYSQPSRLERGERYIAPLYNQLISDGELVYMHSVPLAGVHPLGTPEEVERFRYERQTSGPDSELQRGQAAAGLRFFVLPGRTQSE